jgi:protein involved in polysaccharide export with SLBB domain
MPRFEFSLSGPDESLRLAGAVTSPTFAQAMDAIVEQAQVGGGDQLEIGVAGFPPAHFAAHQEGFEDPVVWKQEGQKAA